MAAQYVVQKVNFRQRGIRTFLGATSLIGMGRVLGGCREVGAVPKQLPVLAVGLFLNT